KAVQDHGIQQDIAHLPILAATSPYLAGGRAGPMFYARIPLGPVTQKHVSQIAPFRDDVCAVVVTGADLYNWLERSCMAYCLTEDGGSLTDEGIPSFNFDSIFGTQAIYDPRQTKQDDHLRA
ncbi:MAG: 5'-nucleotidase C-terminal domain-containing protein, partial [Rhodobacteraceae bacterium]|nr:5'-nucleotidase C-terminal domain-containing protein [Paracoccaceae bacterium]